jgi:hypothetical protein
MVMKKNIIFSLAAITNEPLELDIYFAWKKAINSPTM